MRRIIFVLLLAGCGGAPAADCPFAAPSGPCAPGGLTCVYGTQRCICAANADGIGASWLCDGVAPDLASANADLTTTPIDFAGADLTGADLAGDDLSPQPRTPR